MCAIVITASNVFHVTESGEAVQKTNKNINFQRLKFQKACFKIITLITLQINWN